MAAVSVLAAGCGSGTGNPASTPAPKARTSAGGGELAELVASADPICRRMNAEFAAEPPKSTTIAEVGRVSPVRARIERGVAVELSHLRAPASITAQWRSVVADRMTLASELAALGEAAERGDSASIAKLKKSKARLHRHVRIVAAKLGLRDCAQVG